MLVYETRGDGVLLRVEVDVLCCDRLVVDVLELNDLLLFDLWSLFPGSLLERV
jgi:hypothetical protein